MVNATTKDVVTLAQEVLIRANVLAGYSAEPGNLTRTFLCPAMRGVHQRLTQWIQSAGMAVRLDALGNLIGHYPALQAEAPVFLLGSHVDTVPDAGKYDGVLGVLLAIAAVEALRGQRFPHAIEVLAFSEEEGVRFGTPYLGSKAVCGCFEPELLERTDAAGVSVAQALRNFDLDPALLAAAAYPPGQVLGYLEAHIEQGPVLEAHKLPLGVVEAIVGQSRLWIRFVGNAGHAGTLPMEMRRDALTAAAEFVGAVESLARATPGLRATVGALSVTPGATNVVPGLVRLSLDVRHAEDVVREQAIAMLLARANAIGLQRGVSLEVERAEHHRAVPADVALTDRLMAAAQTVGLAPLRMVSGAGHDAAVMASIAPMTMLFLRSPGGISHHPDEAVLLEDVEAALAVMVAFLKL